MKLPSYGFWRETFELRPSSSCTATVQLLASMFYQRGFYSLLKIRHWPERSANTPLLLKYASLHCGIFFATVSSQVGEILRANEENAKVSWLKAIQSLLTLCAVVFS